jgi:WD40 repeat protein
VLDERSQLRVVLTLRADFTDRPLQYVDFGEICRQRVEMVLPMTPDELEQAIACPAERVGLVIEPDLVAAIVHDVEGQPGALPLLEYALTELFDLREGRLVTKAAYDRIGGVLGALGRRAEEGYATLDEPGKEATRQLFLRLVTLGEGTEDTRRRVARTELDTLQNTNPDIANYPSPINQVVETFGRARLLSFDRDPITRGPTLEVAHEALLHEWPRLRDWLANSREDVRMQRLLAGETGEWLRGGRDPSFLLSGTRLAQFEAWAGESAVALTLDERAYLDTSLQERQRQNDEETARQQRELEAARKLADIERQRAEEQFSAAKRLRRRAWVLVGMVGIGLILAIIAILFAQQARNNASHAQKAEAGALENLAKSEAQRLAAESNRLSIEGHSSEVAALLALRSLGLQYTVQGDEALSRASRQVYPLHVLNAADDVRGIAFNGDGTQIVTNSNDDEVRLWDVASGQLLRTFHGEIGTPNSVDISSDGRYVAALGNNVVVWDPNTGRELLSIDNTLILTNSEGISITTAQGITLSYCFNIDISSDGNYLLVGHKDGTARIWEISTGKEVQRFPGHLGGPMSMVFSPDDRYVLASDNIADQEGIIEVRLWDADTAELLHVFAQHRDVVQGLAFSPDGKTIFTASYDMSACFWDVESGQLIRCTHPGTSLIFNAAFSPDGRYALTGGADGVARLWEVSTGQVIHRYSQSGSIGGVAFSPDGKMVATASFDGTACIWTTEASLVQKEFTVPGITINYFSFSPDGRSIAAGVNDGMVRVWDVNTGQETLTFNGLGSPVWEASYSADGKVIFAASLSGLLFTWDASTGITLSQFTLPITAMVFADISPDGKTIVANNDFNHSYMIDAASGEVLKQFPKAFYCQTVAISPDGSRVALGITGGGAGISGQTWLFSYPGLEKLFMFDYPTDTCFTDMDFSSDGRLLLSAGALGNNDLVLWDMNTGKKLQQFTGFSKMQFGVALSPDGRYAAGAGFDNIARIWEIATGQEVRRLVGHSQALYGIDFSSDGKWVATSSMDGTLKLWYTNLEDLKAAMCKVLPRDLTAEERADYGIADNGPTCPKFANLSSGTP